MHESVVKVSRLNKTFGARRVLHDLSLDVLKGEMVALIGSSGSGKSTLLRHLAGLTCGDARRGHDDGGKIAILGAPVQQRGKLSRDIRRTRSSIGYIFQQFNLVGRLNVLDNVLLGCLGTIPRWRGTCGLFSETERERALRALERVGMTEYAQRRASTLSGGQQQRVAIARTLTQQAEVILADEPIASLDPESARNVMDILADINNRDRKTVIVTLHQVDYARRYCERTVALRQGRIHFNGPTVHLDDAFLARLYGSGEMHAAAPALGRPADVRLALAG